MDCGSGRQPDLPAFTQRRDSGIGLYLARRGDCRCGVAAQFLKVKLIYPATVALRNSYDIDVDLDLFDLLRQVTKQVGDVTADRLHVSLIQFYSTPLASFVSA